VVDEVLTIDAPHYIEHGIRVEQQCPPTLPLVSADAERIKQVLLNLCQNAAEAMPHRGTLTIRGYTVGEQVCLDVEDTGVGIPDDVDVFVPFTTTKTEGIGLGLLIVRRIVSAHGASLTYTSQLGRGTTFTLTFPAPKLGTRLI
jgi:signal transduction histidine kinase